MTSRVSEACQPILRSGWPTERPGVPASTMNVVMPRCASAAVRAATTRTSAIPALVMNILVPLRRNPSPASPAPRTGVARVVMPPTFDPVPGSVTAIEPIFSPETRPGR